MTKFKGPNKYACKIGHKLVQFTLNGTYETDNQEVIDVLNWLSHISIMWVSDTPVVEKTIKDVEEVEETIEEIEEDEEWDIIEEDEDYEEVKEEYTLENARVRYEDVIWKSVPNNKKNDLEWILSKLS